ncbi:MULTISPECIES: hypothetical protein [Pirellulaceae]|nr:MULTISPECIES: hypothetical protein [Pirellulaceae]
MMKIRFGSWNVNHRKLRQAHLDILLDAQVHLLACQEVSASFHAALDASGLFDWSVSSLDLRPPEPDEGRARRLGCSLFGRGDLSLIDASLLPDLVFPERALVAKVRAGDSPFTACCFHAPPGANWGVVKPQTLVKIAEWLSEREGSSIVGIDANCPKFEHLDITQNEWWWADEPKLLGPSPIHAMKDAFRIHLSQQPQELEGIIKQRPNGPLAVSHVRGNSRKRTECRYDFVYISDDIGVKQVRYDFGNQVRASSDHALVLADLVVPVS